MLIQQSSVRCTHREIRCLISARSVSAIPTEEPVNGLHVTFTGRRGALGEGTITVGPPGRVKATDNQVNVFLKAPLAPGMPFCFKVSSESEAIFIHTALWSSNFKVVGPADIIQSSAELKSC
jgi:hypothetical protein